MPDKFSKNAPKSVIWNASGVSFDTQKLPDLEKIRHLETRSTILKVCAALKEKGYDPVMQIAGYVLSGDPTYITSYKDARKMISRMERDYLLEEFVKYYLDTPERD